MSVRAVAVFLLVLLVAGCTTAPVTQTTSSHTTVPPPFDARVLPTATATNATVRPLSFAAPVTVGTGFLGEPTLLSDAKGRLLLTFPGCDGKHASGCNNAPIWRSSDSGKSWLSLNQAKNGSLDPTGPDANGDAMLALGADGSLYASNLGTGLPHWRSSDDGATWSFVGDPVLKGHGADRQWGWAGPAGMVVSAWMATSPDRTAAVSVSRDGGANWTKPFEADASIGWIGPVAGSPDGRALFVPYTKPMQTDAVPDPSGLGLVADPQTELRLLRSLDGGATWEVVRTPHVILKNPASAQWPGTLMAPIVARTGDGALVYVWSEQNLDAQVRATGAEASVYAMRSTDNGTTWSAPRILSGSRTALMPWVIPTTGGSYAVAWYGADDVRADHDYEGTWNVDVVLVDAASPAQGTTFGTVAKAVHTGGICARGGVCGLTLADRSMLDFMGGAMLPDGRIAVAFCSSPGSPTSGLLGSSNTAVMVAVQQDGRTQ